MATVVVTGVEASSAGLVLPEPLFRQFKILRTFHVPLLQPGHFKVLPMPLHGGYHFSAPLMSIHVANLHGDSTNSTIFV